MVKFMVVFFSFLAVILILWVFYSLFIAATKFIIIIALVAGLTYLYIKFKRKKSKKFEKTVYKVTNMGYN